ncbi:MAG: FAD:protein FMN transferase [Acidimicrobiales bacterium]
MIRSRTASRAFRAIGTTALVAVTDPFAADTAAAILRAELQSLDEACSRFRPDSELAEVQRRAGTPVPVSDLLFEVVDTACDVARITEGAVDPTVGRALEALGYDRDFGLLGDGEPRLGQAPLPAPGWWTIDLDRRRRTITVPPGVHVDVGSSAKAFAADRAAWLVAEETGTGVLVSLGGDVATAGPAPDEGWPIGIARDAGAPVHAVDQVVAIPYGGLASSSPGVRSWRSGGRCRHHIVDPRTGDCAPCDWVLVSATAPTCVEANAMTTAAIVWGDQAVRRLVDAGHPARLVAADGEVVTLNGWPDEGANRPHELQRARR